MPTFSFYAKWWYLFLMISHLKIFNRVIKVLSGFQWSEFLLPWEKDPPMPEMMTLNSGN